MSSLLTLAQEGLDWQQPTFDWHAFAPEIVIVATITVLILLDLFSSETNKWTQSSVAGIGVLVAMLPVVTLAYDDTTRSLFGGAYVVDDFALVLKACDVQVRRLMGWSLLEALTAEDARLGDIEVSCPAIVSMAIALAALWRSWGIEPAAVVGHSIGEVAAAHVAGVLSLEDAMRVICHQGRTVGKLKGKGAMAVVGLPWARVGEALPEFAGQVWRVIHASPEWTVGLRFLTPLEFEYDGAEATFKQTLTNIVLPPQNPICYPAGTHPACGGNPNATVAIDALLMPQFTTGGALVDQGVQIEMD